MTQPGKQKLSRDAYHVAWIAPGSEVALDPARLMFDSEHVRPDFDADGNEYVCGTMAGHNVAIVTTPVGQRMNVTSAKIAASMVNTFPNLKIVLLVGIGGGVPDIPHVDNPLKDIHLGDVVIGCATDGKSAVVQYDTGILLKDGLELHGTINRPDPAVLQALSHLESNYRSKQTDFRHHTEKLSGSSLNQETRQFEYPGLQYDQLFRAGYHGHHSSRKNKQCDRCDTQQLVERQPRSDEHTQQLVFHKGRIGTGNKVIANGEERDEISKSNGGIRCFEGSAAGVDASKNCLVIRGISDYCDAHKNNTWKHYAAGRAAVFARELLANMTPAVMRRIPYVTGGDIKPTLLKSLQFGEQKSRYSAIQNAGRGTGDWIIEEYQDWITHQNLDDPCCLWLKGKPGSGKSTLMKLMYRCLKDPKMLKRKVGTSDAIVIAFFFNGRGVDLEKSVLGMYRSLLFQIIDNPLADHLRTQSDVFTNPFSMPQDLTEDYEWTIRDLQDLFQAIIEALGDVIILCFIDALDEGDDGEICDMIDFMASLRSTNFKPCFSSRPYTNISVQRTVELKLDFLERHYRDVSIYVSRNLKIGHDESVRTIRKRIEEKAAGIFLWARLVVDRLNADYRSNPSAPFADLERTLDGLPQDLGKLFLDRLQRGAAVREELVLCFQLLLFAQTALSPDQVYQAILSVTHKHSFTSSRQMDSKDIKDYFENLSKGLIEVIPGIPSDDIAERIRFIHGSVRDFLLNDEGLAELAPQLRSNLCGLSHEQLSLICRDYFTRVIENTETENERTRSQKFTFFDYSVIFVLHHSDIAASYNIRQAKFLQDFPLSKWIEWVYNGVYRKESFRRVGPFQHTMLNSMGSELHVFAAFDLPHLLRDHIRDHLKSVKHSIPKSGKLTMQSPLMVAITNDKRKAVSTFLDSAVSLSSDHANLLSTRNAFCESYLTSEPCVKNHWVSHRVLNFWLPNWLPFKYFRYFNTDRGKRGPPVKAILKTHPGLFLLLLQAGLFTVHDLAYNDPDGTLLHIACRAMSNATPDYHRMSCEAFRAFLFTLITLSPLDVDAQNQQGYTALHFASECRHSDFVVDLLVNMVGADPNVQNSKGNTALHIAAHVDNQDEVKVLLSPRPGLDRKPGLDMPHKNGHTSSKCLKHSGNASGSSFSDQLKEIMHSSNYTIGAERTLQSDPNIRDREGKTALHVAAERSNHNIVRMLLQDKRVDPNAREKRGRTALLSVGEKASYANQPYSATERARDEMLRDPRVDTSIEDVNGRTAYVPDRVKKEDPVEEPQQERKRAHSSPVEEPEQEEKRVRVHN